MSVRVIPALLAGLLFAGLFLHTRAVTGAEREPGLSVGLVVNYEQTTYRDYEPKVLPLPAITYTTSHFSITSLSAELNILNLATAGQGRPMWGLDIKAMLNIGIGYRRDKGDSNTFDGMDKRRNPTTLGVGAKLTIPLGSISFTRKEDITGEHAGISEELRFGFPLFFADSVFLFGSIGSMYFDGRYVDYYYGVRAHEVTADRGAYIGTEASNRFVGYRLIYKPAGDWQLIHSLRRIRQDDVVVNSTLTTDEKDYWRSFLLVQYHF